MQSGKYVISNMLIFQYDNEPNTLPMQYKHNSSMLTVRYLLPLFPTRDLSCRTWMFLSYIAIIRPLICLLSVHRCKKEEQLMHDSRNRHLIIHVPKHIKVPLARIQQSSTSTWHSCFLVYTAFIQNELLFKRNVIYIFINMLYIMLLYFNNMVPDFCL